METCFTCEKKKQYTYNCANCGANGHMHKSCNHPITSYGIICYRLNYDQDNHYIYPEYLMVQRKDSLSYVEFLRGKYNIENRNYILKLFSNMTEKERKNISTHSFDVLWKNLWQINNTQTFQKEFSEAKKKFMLLYNGYIIQCPTTKMKYTCNIKNILSNCKTALHENEWGFPKGRRNINEKDIFCAIREFVEEAGIESKLININFDQKPYEEIFNGSNKIRYRHIYYIANMPIINNVDLKPIKSTLQSLEIKDVKWFKYNEAQSKISDQNIERKELLKRINYSIVKNIIK